MKGEMRDERSVHRLQTHLEDEREVSYGNGNGGRLLCNLTSGSLVPLLAFLSRESMRSLSLPPRTEPEMLPTPKASKTRPTTKGS